MVLRSAISAAFPIAYPTRAPASDRDLEKVCDYITFIHGGKIVFSEEKDALLEKYVVAKLSEAELRSLEPGKVAGVRRSSFGAEALVERSAARGLVCDPASIEDIMLYFLKGESK